MNDLRPFSRPLSGYGIWLAIYLLAGVVSSGPALAGSAYIGMQPQELPPQAMAALGLDSSSGVIIRNVGQDTPASKAGIRQGDVLLRINDKNVATLDQLVAIITKSKPGDVLNISLHRIGEVIDLKLVVGDWDNASRARKNKSALIDNLGLTIIALTEKVRGQFKIRWDVEGVMVSIVDPARGISEVLKRGDVIVQINQQKIWLPGQLVKVYEQSRRAGRKNIIMLVLRNSGFVFIVLPVR